MAGIDWDVHYQSGNPPWETGQPSRELARVIAEQKIQPCRMVELGCGSGINAVWLAQQGFELTALDFNTLAIEKARQRAQEAGVKIQFELADVLKLPKDFGKFPFFFDRGCYHSVRGLDVKAFVRTLEQLTEPGSLGLLLTGNARDPHEVGMGPPVVSEEEFHAELEGPFEIVQLREFHFDRYENDPPILAWSCLVRRRAKGP